MSPSPQVTARMALAAKGLRWMLAALGAALGLATAAPAGSPKPVRSSHPGVVAEVKLRGRVVDLTEEMQRLYGAERPDPGRPLWGFRTDAGACYTLLRTRYSEALFVDPRLRTKELILKGRVYPRTHLFDVSGVQSIRNGVVCDLYYYCYTCSIRALAPGPCVCCQQPVVLVEKPHVH